MNRRTVVKRLAAMATVIGLAGCTSSPTDVREETTTETQTASKTQGETTTKAWTGTAIETQTETGDEETMMTAGPTTDATPPDIPRPGTPPVSTETTAGPDSCSLSHQIVGSGDELTPGDGPVLRYENLSPEAKRVVSQAVESGGVSIPYDSLNRPPEFTYSDGATPYTIEYRGTTYRLFTSTNAGCPVITAGE